MFKVLLIIVFAMAPMTVVAQEEDGRSNYARTAEDNSSVSSNMRKREHKLSWDQSSVKNEYEVEGATSDIESKSTKISISYARNFGQYEVGVGYAGGNSESDGDESSNAVIAISGRFNFTENVPGNDLVPYFMLSLLSYSEDGDLSGTDYDVEGTGHSIEFGINYFPFGEILALEFGYGMSSISGDFDQTGSSKVDVDFESRGFFTGFAVYF